MSEVQSGTPAPVAQRLACALPTLAELLRQLQMHPPGLEEVRGHLRFDLQAYTCNIVGESDLYRLLVCGCRAR